MDPGCYARMLSNLNELLTITFSYLDHRDLVQVALVCKRWSEIALDALWCEVSDLKRVLAVLAPLVLRPISMGKIQNAYVSKAILVSSF